MVATPINDTYNYTASDGQRREAQGVVQMGPAPVPSSSGATPATGTITSANTTIGPFTPAVGRPVKVRLAGTFGGATVQVEVSYDSGTSWSALTVAGQTYASFTAPAAEAVDEAGDTTTRYRLTTTGATGTTSVAAYLGH